MTPQRGVPRDVSDDFSVVCCRTPEFSTVLLKIYIVDGDGGFAIAGGRDWYLALVIFHQPVETRGQMDLPVINGVSSEIEVPAETITLLFTSPSYDLNPFWVSGIRK